MHKLDNVFMMIAMEKVAFQATARTEKPIAQTERAAAHAYKMTSIVE